MKFHDEIPQLLVSQVGLRCGLMLVWLLYDCMAIIIIIVQYQVNGCAECRVDLQIVFNAN